MEGNKSSQLPEVDSLPDGFVDSPTEHLAPATPEVEKEKSVSVCQDDGSTRSDCSDVAVSYASDDVSTDKRTRTFPVPLCEVEEMLEVSNGESVEKNEFGSSLEASPQFSQCEKQVTGEGECQAGVSELKITTDIHSREKTTSYNVDSQKTKKQDTIGTRQKGTKKSLRSEMEILEFAQKYKEVLAEKDAAVAARNRLESLCRVLQDQNKMLRDECKKVSTDGQKMRLDLSAKFQDAIKDVGIKLEEQKDECLSQLKENETLRSKLKQLAEQFTLSEQTYGQKLKQKSLELQISDLKNKQYEEKLAHEQSQMKVYAEQVSQLLATEKNLRQQLTADGEKFQQFQDALVKSNEVFETFKQEIDRMSKSIKELRKENSFLKSKCENSDCSLIELFKEKEHLRKQLEKTTNQKMKLESLCRSLRAESKANTTTGSSATESVTCENQAILNE